MFKRNRISWAIFLINIFPSLAFAKKGLMKLFSLGGDNGAVAQGEFLGIPVEILLALASMAVAALLATVLAYHPLRLKDIRADQESREQPKALLLIAIAGAIVGALVRRYPAMALALFGFGSFIRFRTPVPNPKETAILFICAGIGCLCGLAQFVLAVMGTAFVYLLIWILDREALGGKERVTLVLKGLGPEAQVAAKAYKEKLAQAGIAVLSSKVSLKKGNVTILLAKDKSKDTDQIEKLLFGSESLPRPRSIAWVRE